ncbi:hypothetical protein C7B65_10445 [Phormidesmis priestleyi ULC007]|uniref:Uncharacterized protein n=1 Tax=Phormidesmis priestleyi ULC007 TaxID=1920490 RepID=A0A2T1DGV5_9CYAN|nr:hypothetical protein [Phormidesmis priestleyi]PSB19703.1 hypothetical protein C7B65_10445 [Phormidesmis priestleyi ULC007]PZO53587.1 MAG: hypothetical protein DCF14_04150 [Phormidesmis priestleyi]
MDTLQKQINSMNGKIDGLHQVLEQLTGNLSQVVTEIKSSSGNGSSFSSFGGSSGRYYQSPRSTDPLMEHKDVLADSHASESSMQGGEKALSPEVQIQRLTAQLTAAYNRIAALEEQLLAQRVH